MATRFIKVGSGYYINPWNTAGVVPTGVREWCKILMHSGESIVVDAPVSEVVAAIEADVANDSDHDFPELAAPVGFAR